MVKYQSRHENGQRMTTLTKGSSSRFMKELRCNDVTLRRNEANAIRSTTTPDPCIPPSYSSSLDFLTPTANSRYANYKTRLNHANWLRARTQSGPTDQGLAFPTHYPSTVLDICVSNLGPEIWIVGACQLGAVGDEDWVGRGGRNEEKCGEVGEEKRF